MSMKQMIAGVSTIVMVVGGLAAVATPDAHADDGATPCINGTTDGVPTTVYGWVYLSCMWWDPYFNNNGNRAWILGGSKIHNATPVYNTSSNVFSSFASVPGPTAYTYYYDQANGVGNPMFTLADHWVWASLPSSYNDKISSVWITASNT